MCFFHDQFRHIFRYITFPRGLPLIEYIWSNISLDLSFPQYRNFWSASNGNFLPHSHLLDWDIEKKLHEAKCKVVRGTSCRWRVECGKGNWLRMSYDIVIYKSLQAFTKSLCVIVRYHGQQIRNSVYCSCVTGRFI